MIKVPEDVVREFPVKLGIDRDCEIPLLLEFLQGLGPIESLLDVGAHTSCLPEKYGQELRPLVKKYEGVDILPPTETESIMDNYFIGNMLELPLEPYDVVICVSTIEHAGLSTYKGDHVAERMKIFKRCLELTKKYLWISFPVGQEYVYPNELAPITKEQLEAFEDLTKGFKVKERFVYSQGPQSRHPWYEHNKRDVALRIPYIDYIGNQSICVLEIEK